MQGPWATRSGASQSLAEAMRLKEAGVMVPDVKTRVGKLKTEAKVL
ncbi:protein of unknown function [Burkholderia multivorans]